MEYLVHVLTTIGIYAIVAASLNLAVGYTGMFSLAQAGLVVIGAYTAGLMAVRLHTPLELNLLCAILLAAVLGGCIGRTFARVRGDHFALATMSLQMLVICLLNNCSLVTNGPEGIGGIRAPRSPLGEWGNNPEKLCGLVYVVLACTLLGITYLIRSPLGRVLIAIREDEVYVEGLGRDVCWYKAVIMGVVAALAAVAGVLYAHHVGYISPRDFQVMESVFVLAMVVIGGAGSSAGSVLGALVLVMVPELLRFLDMPSTLMANIRQIVYGLILLIVVSFRPRGLIGRFDF